VFDREVFALAVLFPQTYIFLAELVASVVCVALPFRGGRWREDLAAPRVCEFSYEKGTNGQNDIDMQLIP